jgi:hypothetical protein
VYEHRSPNMDDGLLKVDIFDAQTANFADSHAASKMHREEDLILGLRGIDDLPCFLWREVTLLLLNSDGSFTDQVLDCSGNTSLKTL